LLEKDVFRVRVLFVLPPKCAKLSPLVYALEISIYRKKCCLVSKLGASTSFSFFVNLILLIFLDFSYQHRLE